MPLRQELTAAAARLLRRRSGSTSRSKPRRDRARDGGAAGRALPRARAAAAAGR